MSVGIHDAAILKVLTHILEEQMAQTELLAATAIDSASPAVAGGHVTRIIARLEKERAARA